MENKSFRKPSLRENVIWNTIGSIIYWGTQWLTAIVLFREMGSSEAGVYQLSMTITAVFISIALFGMRSYQVSDVKRDYSDGTYMASRIFTVGAAFVAGVIFVLINGYQTHFVICIILYLVFKMSEAVVDVIHGVDQKCMKMDYVGISFGLRGLLSFIVFYVACRYMHNLELAILAMGISVYLVIFLYDIPAMRRLSDEKPDFDFKKLMPLFIICIPLVGYNFFMNGNVSIARYILEKMVPTENFGFYTSVATPAVIVQTAATFIYAPFITSISETYEKKDIKGYKKILFTVFGIIGLICVAAIIGSYFLGEYLLVLILGEDIRAWVYLFMPVVYSTCIIAFAWFISTILIVIRRLKTLLVITGAGFLFSAVIAAPLIRAFDMNGATYAVIISQLFMIVSYLFVVFYDIKKCK